MLRVSLCPPQHPLPTIQNIKFQQSTDSEDKKQRVLKLSSKTIVQNVARKEEQFRSIRRRLSSKEKLSTNLEGSSVCLPLKLQFHEKKQPSSVTEGLRVRGKADIRVEREDL